MERFAIKIDKSVKARLKNLCRLCGIDNPDQIDILKTDWSDVIDVGEATLSCKIYELVGIQVMKNDKMPQRICTLCCDKINDFYEFREMCTATNIQTRKLLNLPEVKRPSKKAAIKAEEANDVESIFGVVGDDVKAEPSAPQKPTKKLAKKAAGKLSAREAEIAMELERIKQEEELEQQTAETELKARAGNRTKGGKKVDKKKLKGKKAATEKATDGPLLAPKPLNSRERRREIEEKKNEKKRKADSKLAVASKKIKKEPVGISCLICTDRFDKNNQYTNHLVTTHLPTIQPYGCSSCVEQFSTEQESTSHHEWHKMFSETYKCPLCSLPFEKLMTFQRHISTCKLGTFAAIPVVDNIFCELCNVEFVTQNLYDWHDCFIKNNAPCPKCFRVFIKKNLLFKHLFKCTGTGIPPAAVEIQAPKRAGRPRKDSLPNHTMGSISSFKAEPETIIDQNMTHESDDDRNYDDDNFMDTHFGDSDNDFDASDSIIGTSTMAEISPAGRDSGKRLSSTFVQPPADRSKKRRTDTRNFAAKKIVQIEPLLHCCVKLEPMDIHSFPNIHIHNLELNAAMPNAPEPTENDVSQAIVHSSEAEAQPELEPERTPIVAPAATSASSPRKQTVPPLTIRIKKEVMHPGYGDVFDPVLARNIKQEKAESSYEIANRPTPTNRSKQQVNGEKQKKLYKKPALLAIKIKQERFERESSSGYEEDNSYHDYSVPFAQDDYTENASDQPIDSPMTLPITTLPIITQIHSLPDGGPSFGNQLHFLGNRSTTNSDTNLNPFSANVEVNKIPFKPIRIKSEFGNGNLVAEIPAIESVNNGSEDPGEPANHTDVINTTDNQDVVGNITRFNEEQTLNDINYEAPVENVNDSKTVEYDSEPTATQSLNAEASILESPSTVPSVIENTEPVGMEQPVTDESVGEAKPFQEQNDDQSTEMVAEVHEADRPFEMFQSNLSNTDIPTNCDENAQVSPPQQETNAEHQNEIVEDLPESLGELVDGIENDGIIEQQPDDRIIEQSDPEVKTTLDVHSFGIVQLTDKREQELTNVSDEKKKKVRFQLFDSSSEYAEPQEPEEEEEEEEEVETIRDDLIENENQSEDIEDTPSAESANESILLTQLQENISTSNIDLESNSDLIEKHELDPIDNIINENSEISNISAIDEMSELNAEDANLNFIDELVQEVAETIAAGDINNLTVDSNLVANIDEKGEPIAQCEPIQIAYDQLLPNNSTTTMNVDISSAQIAENSEQINEFNNGAIDDANLVAADRLDQTTEGNEILALADDQFDYNDLLPSSSTVSHANPNDSNAAPSSYSSADA